MGLERTPERQAQWEKFRDGVRAVFNEVYGPEDGPDAPMVLFAVEHTDEEQVSLTSNAAAVCQELGFAERITDALELAHMHHHGVDPSVPLAMPEKVKSLLSALGINLPSAEPEEVDTSDLDSLPTTEG